MLDALAHIAVVATWYLPVAPGILTRREPILIGVRFSYSTCPFCDCAVNGSTGSHPLGSPPLKLLQLAANQASFWAPDAECGSAPSTTITATAASAAHAPCPTGRRNCLFPMSFSLRAGQRSGRLARTE
ncbi:hypothetical protein D3C71_1477960 [compost metagenome]